MTDQEKETLEIDVANVFPNLDDVTHAKIVAFVSDDRNIEPRELKNIIKTLFDLIGGLNGNICEMDARIMRLEHQE